LKCYVVNAEGEMLILNREQYYIWNYEGDVRRRLKAVIPTHMVLRRLVIDFG
jgi:hypothetical protein